MTVSLPWPGPPSLPDAEAEPIWLCLTPTVRAGITGQPGEGSGPRGSASNSSHLLCRYNTMDVPFRPEAQATLSVLHIHTLQSPRCRPENVCEPQGASPLNTLHTLFCSHSCSPRQESPSISSKPASLPCILQNLPLFHPFHDSRLLLAQPGSTMVWSGCYDYLCLSPW